MARPNPGPFEPVIYVIQTPMFFRIVGMGGLVLFVVLSLAIAAAHGAGYFFIGLVLFTANWLDLTVGMCRRCRHYGTWHCGGQGMIVARLFSRSSTLIGDLRMRAHFILTALLLLYCLFWLWHSILLGIIFTIWVPLAAISAIAPNGFSWRRSAEPSTV
jgi:hypothetical protein